MCKGCTILYPGIITGREWMKQLEGSLLLVLSFLITKSKIKLNSSLNRAKNKCHAQRSGIWISYVPKTWWQNNFISILLFSSPTSKHIIQLKITRSMGKEIPPDHAFQNIRFSLSLCSTLKEQMNFTTEIRDIKNGILRMRTWPPTTATGARAF